jgi:predicted TIM-barrel fold metal-dependent hydrolase
MADFADLEIGDDARAKILKDNAVAVLGLDGRAAISPSTNHR